MLDLKANPENPPDRAEAFAPWPAASARSGARARGLALAMALSLLAHASFLALLVSFGPRMGDDGPGSLVVDTRTANPGPAVDFMVTFPEEAVRPKAAPALVAKPVPAEPPTQAVTTPRTSAAASEEANFASGPRQRRAESPSTPAGDSSEDRKSEGGASGGGAAGISFFRIPVRGQQVVFVIDRSASMGLNGAFAAARKELLASLDRLPAEASFQVIAYNRGAEPLRPGGRVGLIPASPEMKRQARRLLESLRAEGGTDHLAALKRGLLLQPDVLFFLSDADDLTGEQIQAISRFNRGRTIIHTVAVTASPRADAENPLRELARANGGMFRMVDLEHEADNIARRASKGR